MAKKIPEFKETTSLQQFRGTIDFLNTQIQLVDASFVNAIKILRNYNDKKKDISFALGVDLDKYNKLNHPVKQHQIIFNFAQSKNIEFAIIQLYNAFTNYLHSIVDEMFKKKPLFIVSNAVTKINGEDKDNLTLKYAEIIKLGSYNLIEKEIVDRIYRSYEDLQSTIKLIEKVTKDTQVNIPKAMQKEALKYLEMRHLFTHKNGIVDNKYASTYGEMWTPALKNGEKLPRKYSDYLSASNAIYDFITLMDSELIRTGFVDSRKFKEKTTTNK